MSDIKWIKFAVDIFDDEAIELIEQMPDGDALLIIWFKLLTKAGKTNNGGLVYFKENIPYTDEMLATVFKKPLNTIRMALNIFKQFGMIEITTSNEILISNWGKHQNIDGMERARELQRARTQKSRLKKKQLLLESSNNTENQKCNVTVTLPTRDVTHVEEDIEVDKEEDIDIEVDNVVVDTEEKRKEKEKTTTTSKNVFFSKNISGMNADEYTKYCDENIHGEYNNVYLTQTQYKQLQCLIMNKTMADEIINEVSRNIVMGKVPNMTETQDDKLHFVVCKSYWDYRRKNPDKFKKNYEIIQSDTNTKEDMRDVLRLLDKNKG